MAHQTLHPVKPTEKGAGGFCHVPCCLCSWRVFGLFGCRSGSYPFTRVFEEGTPESGTFLPRNSSISMVGLIICPLRTLIANRRQLS
jgi:hypothetical protein